jgi:hypothetical protein
MSKWEEWKKAQGETKPWDLINPNTEWADEEKAKQRYIICQDCPSLISLTKQCKKCGCIMPMKVKLEKSACPIGKW